jgi:prefoldin subunit 5
VSFHEAAIESLLEEERTLLKAIKTAEQAETELSKELDSLRTATTNESDARAGQDRSATVRY